MSGNTSSKSTWASVTLIALVFAGYRVISGSSLTHDLGSRTREKRESSQPVTQNQNQPASAPSELPPAAPIAQNSDPRSSQRLSDLQEKAIGFLAQTICSARLYDYTREQVDQKIDYFIEAYQAPSSLRQWMSEPRVASVAAKLSMAFSPNCNSLDADSSDAREAFRMMDSL
jgi:hypothetical protein